MPIDKEQIKKDYFTFDGRIGKKQYLTSFLILLGLYILTAIVGGILGSIIGGLASLLALIVYIALTIAYFSIAIRRFHDLDKTGLLSLLLLIPVICLIVIIYLCIADGTTGPNKYGV